MRRKEDIGAIFGFLVIEAEAAFAIDPKSGNRLRRWKCRCSCGKTGIYRQNDLRTGKTMSCGCLKDAVLEKRNFKHGLRWGDRRTYYCWLGLRTRCNNPKAVQYKDYGGRGIRVCDRWNDFMAFYKDMGPRPIGMSIDRIDNNGDYSPENCRWATFKQQLRNTRRSRFVTFNGDRRNLAELCETMGVKYMSVWNRLNKGVSPEEAIRLAAPRPLP